MQLDIETSTLTHDQSDAQILMVALSDNRGYEELLEGDEQTILRQLTERIQELDPDVIEGHNLFGFDLPYLHRRAQALGMALRWGRDGSELRFGSRAIVIGANNRTFTPAFVHGRHLLDTYLAVQRFDIGRGDLEKHGLKEAAQQLGIALEGASIWSASKSHLWRTDPDTVRQYCCRMCAKPVGSPSLVLPTEFYQCQMIPDTLQDLATIGTGEKANLLFVRAYLMKGHANSSSRSQHASIRGYTEVRMVGRIERVVKADVESLYPSVMLQFHIKPKVDTLNVFLPMLASVRQRRLDAKPRPPNAGAGSGLLGWAAGSL